MKLLVLDTETTDKPPNIKLLSETVGFWPHVVQLSFILFDTTTYKYTEYDYIIRTKCVIENDHIHGITTARNRECGHQFNDIYAIFSLCLAECDLIVGHNLQFDLNMLHAECLRNSIDFVINKPTYCTMMSTTYVCNLPNHKWPKLEELHRHLFKEEARNLHDSRVDVIACLRCYLYLMLKIDICQKIKKLSIV